MIPIGWSAGDIATACVILFHVIKALDAQKGASKQYRESHAFLCGLYRVVIYVSDDDRASGLPEDARLQVQSISNAYMDFHAYISKFVNLNDPDKDKLKRMLSQIRWSWNELNNKIQSLKTNSLSAIAIMETLIVMDLSSRVNSLLRLGDRQETSIATATTVLHDVRQQLLSLSQVSEEYRQLFEDMNRAENFHQADMQNIEGRLDVISRDQIALQESLDTLMKHLEERASNDQAQQDQWAELLHSKPEPSIYEKNIEQTGENLRLGKEIGVGMGELSGNNTVRQAGERMQGASRLFDVVSKFGFGKSQKSTEDNDRRSMAQVPVPVSAPSERTERRAWKPPPPMPTQPPPQRLHPSAVQASNHGQKQVGAWSRSSPSRNSMVTSCPRPVLQSQQQHQRSDQTKSDMLSNGISRTFNSSNPRLPPALPPRKPSIATTKTSEDTLALAVVEERPHLPPRNYKKDGVGEVIILSSARPLPKKPRHLSSASFSASAAQKEQKPPISRISSASSADSAMSTSSIMSSVSMASTASSAPSIPPTTSPKSPFLAELVKSFEAKNVVDPTGVQRCLPLRQ